MNKKYTILMYNFNDYEIMREPSEVDPECEYLYITDNEKYKTQTKVWNVIVDKELDGLSPFDKCYRVRFNLFKYATTPVCIYVDGSIQIHKSLRKLYDDFMNSGADVGLNIHPDRKTVFEEYYIWTKLRKYDNIRAFECLSYMEENNYDVKNYKGLYQGTVRICKNTELNKTIDKMVFNLLIKLGTENLIERLDQTIYSFILNHYFEKKIKIFPFSQQVFQSNYMSWCSHKSRNKIGYNHNNNNDGFVFNKLEKLYKI